MWKNYLCCVDPGESRAVNAGCGCFCFFLAGRRSSLTRDAILCEPEVSLVGKFRFFRVEPSVIAGVYDVINTGNPAEMKASASAKVSFPS